MKYLGVLIDSHLTFRNHIDATQFPEESLSYINLLTIFDIYKLQVGKLVYDSLHNIGPTKSIIQFTRATEVHTHSTRYASLGNFFNSWVRTSRFGLKNLQVEGGHLWVSLPNNIKESPSRKTYVRRLKHKLINCYPIQ